MKLISYFFVALLTMSGVLSCEKESSSPSTYPIEGLWTGTYSVNTMPLQGSLTYTIAVKPGGEILTEGKGGDGKSHYASGTWALSGNNFTATIITFPFSNIIPVTQSITATYSNTGTLTDGTWTDTNNPNGAGLSGKFSTLQRIN